VTSPHQQVATWVDGQTFRDAMSTLAAPITVITTVDEAGRRRGLTASSVASVSLEPPLLVVSVSRTSSCHAALVSAREFVVNVLSTRHRDLARRFATSGIDRFAGGEFTPWPDRDLPCLSDADVLIRCATYDVITTGDHDLLIGAVAEVRTTPHPDPAPLVWYQRDFHSTAPHGV
jgi:flavin reductase ActVB